MDWKCESNNPKCQYGWIDINTKEMCVCVKVKAVKKTYLEYAEAEKLLMTPLSKLKDLRLIDLVTKKKQTYKELGLKIINNLPQLIADHAKIYFSGNPGSGKSQLASTIILEAAKKYEYLSYYLPTSRLAGAVFDFADKSKLKEIQAKVANPRTKILVVDDCGAEIAKADGRLGELLVTYNNLFREFQKSDGIIIITANVFPEKLREMYSNDARLFDVIFQEGSTKYYAMDDAAFRQQKKAKSLDLLN